MTIGRPIAGNQVYVLDQALNPAPVGIPGELGVGGIGVARGYLGQPGPTAARFVPDPFEPGARLYLTGDRAVQRADGSISFLGRADRQLKIRGIRVEPAEIERAIRDHPGVRDAAVVPWTAGADTRLAGFYVPANGDGPTAGALAAHLESCLPAYLVQSALTVIDRIPLTQGGKADHRALPAPVVSTPGPNLAPPETVVEERVADVWHDLLDVDAGRNDNFFHVGGHSLLAAQLVGRIGEEFGVELPLRAVFDRPTIAQQADAIEQAVHDEVAEMTESELKTQWTSHEESRA